MPLGACFHMHLNRGCRFPDLANLFDILPVDDRVLPILPAIEPPGKRVQGASSAGFRAGCTDRLTLHASV